MGVRPQFDAISRIFDGKLQYNGGKFHKDDGKSSPFIRNRSFFHTQRSWFSYAGGTFSSLNST